MRGQGVLTPKRAAINANSSSNACFGGTNDPEHKIVPVSGGNCVVASSQSVDTESPREKSTTSSSTNTSSDTIPNTDVDPLEVSRFPLRNTGNVATLGKIQEIKLMQKLLKEIKFIQSFDEDVLREQQFYWLYTHNILDSALRTRLKNALESHCMAHMRWLTSCEFEIDIHPDRKIEKVHKKATK